MLFACCCWVTESGLRGGLFQQMGDLGGKGYILLGRKEHTFGLSFRKAREVTLFEVNFGGSCWRPEAWMRFLNGS